MENFHFSKMFLILTVILGTITVDLVNGAGRLLKPNDDDAVVQPQTVGPLAGLFPNPFGGSIPNPGLGGSFPNPGFGGFPNPGLGGSVPNPSLGTGSSFCGFPGVRCAPGVPNEGSLDGGVGAPSGGVGGSNSP